MREALGSIPSVSILFRPPPHRGGSAPFKTRVHLALASKPSKTANDRWICFEQNMFDNLGPLYIVYVPWRVGMALGHDFNSWGMESCRGSNLPAAAAPSAARGLEAPQGVGGRRVGAA